MAGMLLFLSAMALVVDTQLQFRYHVSHTDLYSTSCYGTLGSNFCYELLTVQCAMLIVDTVDRSGSLHRPSIRRVTSVNTLNPMHRPNHHRPTPASA